MTGIIVKRDEDETRDWMRKQNVLNGDKLVAFGLDPKDITSSEIGWLLSLPTFRGKDFDLDSFQVRFLACLSKYRSVLKSRQVGLSLVIAAESLARCHIKESHTAVCISYNLEDAKEKILYVKELHDGLPLEYQKEMITDSKTEVAFASRGSHRSISKVLSHPAKPPRGKSGDVYLDELAHCPQDRAIYAGATAVISRSGGQMTIGSTPLGRRGIFHGVHTEEIDKYPGFWRQEVPWWLCRHFSADVTRAAREAPTMSTEERVETFGTSSLRDQRRALPLEDFQQEFELAFQDERVSFFPYELILPCCDREREEVPLYDSIDHLAEIAIKLGPLELGFDVGRTKNPSELAIVEVKGQTRILRYEESFRNVDFPTQRERLIRILRLLGDHARVFRIDATGLGRNLGEDLARAFGRKIELFNFSQGIKSDLANSLKILFEEKNVVLYKSRDLISQLHSIKQKITTAGNSIFDVERNRFHHGDKVWSLALAAYRVRRASVEGPATVGVRILGEAPVAASSASEPSLGEKLLEVPKAPSPGVPVRPRPVSYADPVAVEAPPVVLETSAVERRVRSLRVSMTVWEREGDRARVAAARLEVSTLLAELARRDRPTVGPTVGEPG